MFGSISMYIIQKIAQGQKFSSAFLIISRAIFVDCIFYHANGSTNL